MIAPANVSPLVAFGILMLSGALAVLAADGRLALLALAGLYVGAGLLMSLMAAPSLAWLHVVIGGLACVILYLGWRAGARSAAESLVALPFRAGAFVLVVFLAGILSAQRPLPFADGLTTLASLVLAGLFIAQAALFREPIRAGMGVLSLLNGVALYLLDVQSGVALTAWALAATLLVALAAAYVQYGRRAPGAEEDA
jgi:hypothetical protein